MDLSELETFLAVVRCGSFSRAAAALYRTQPAVSIAVRKLEDAVGQPLLVRSPDGVRLTEAGRLLVDYAERMLHLRQRARESLEDLQRMRAGQLTLGANESSVHAVLPALAAFRRRWPDVRIAVERCFSREIPRLVLNYRLELGVLSYLPAESPLTAVEFARDALTFVVYPGHRLARRREVDITELGREVFIAHIVESPYRGQVIQLFARHRTPLRRMVELPTIDSIKRFVQMGMGVAIVPRMCVRQEIEQGAMVEVRIRQLRLARRLYAVYRDDTPLSRPAQAFLKLLGGN
jgi:DNA-binding transcriptional LysR family regulator